MKRNSWRLFYLLLIFFHRKGISIPIFSVENPAEFFGALQISEPLVTQGEKGGKGRTKRIFSKKDEALLEMMAKIIGLLIDAHRRDWNSKEDQRKISVYNDSSKEFLRISDFTNNSGIYGKF